MAKHYLDERTGQIEFFKSLRLDEEIAFIDRTDGVRFGTLFEFKLKIDDTNKVLSQAIKYLSRMRIKGESVPLHILLIDLNNELAFHFYSSDFENDVKRIYVGAASKDNSGFSTNIEPERIDTSVPAGIRRVLDIVEDKKYLKVSIDENCVIGWAERFYNENPRAQKRDLFEELRQPVVFREYIKPWIGTEDDFRFIMDCLNDRLHRKELGAYFTPSEYCKISCDMVRRSIQEIPDGNDYIILDRCAGTGNLEQFFTDEELSHCVVGTYELKEWQVLNYLIGDKVRCIIPPIDSRLNRPIMEGENLLSINGLERGNGLLLGADALEVEVFEQVKEYVNNPNCNIIVLENPPYRDTGATDNIESGTVKNCLVAKRMLLEKHKNKNTTTDLSNLFIWSAWKYYLQKPDDQFILYSPIKYWKSLGLSDKKFMEGYLFNRKHFHASQSSIACIRWKNEYEYREQIPLKKIDIILIGNEERSVDFSYMTMKRVHKMSNELLGPIVKYDMPGIICDLQGREVKKYCRGKPYWDESIIGYLRINGYNLDPMSHSLTRVMIYAAMGRYLTKDNYIDKLPLFCAKLYPQENWYEKDVFFTTADGGYVYKQDEDLLRSCFIYTALSQRNKCLSFYGSDNRFYNNELCFDDNTQMTNDLQNMTLNQNDKSILELWNRVLRLAKNTDEYNPKYSYGVWQIENDLNVFWDDTKRIWSDKDKKEENRRRAKLKISKLDLSPKYTDLNTALNALRIALREYYKTEIQDKLFEYELLK